MKCQTIDEIKELTGTVILSSSKIRYDVFLKLLDTLVENDELPAFEEQFIHPMLRGAYMEDFFIRSSGTRYTHQLLSAMVFTHAKSTAQDGIAKLKMLKNLLHTYKFYHFQGLKHWCTVMSDTLKTNTQSSKQLVSRYDYLLDNSKNLVRHAAFTRNAILEDTTVTGKTHAAALALFDSLIEDLTLAPEQGKLLGTTNTNGVMTFFVADGKGGVMKMPAN